ncbi:MAG TPA: endolytic transglycosylase MltG [Candidatus Saccharimonadales bacterium]|nr:endolytic transglycosylase MltG [Candidatus Saccharimonadales bacterium]
MPSPSFKSQRLKKGRLLGTIALILILLMSSAVLIVRQTYISNLKPVSASQHSQLVTIPTGYSVHQIAVLLQKSGVIKKAWAFEWYIRNHDLRDELQAGTYALRPNQGVPEIAVALTQGKIATNLVTIIPGLRLDQIKKTLINAGFSQSDVIKALDPARYASHSALIDKPPGASLEGYLYPDSYQKTATTKPEEIVRAALDQMQKHLTASVRQGFTAQGLSVHQGIILASIVEQEVSNPQDKPIVAQVFLKRLHQDMLLGSDVTAYYGSLLANQAPSLIFESPYNTRLHTGLPPGPISNVTDSSLEAVAHPASTDYLYFVAGDDGVTYFSKTLDEHQAQTTAHCKKLCSQ